MPREAPILCQILHLYTLVHQISSSDILFSYGTPGANFNVKGHVNPFVPSFLIEDLENELWDGEKKTENAHRDQDLSLGQQAYAPAGSMSYGGKSPVFDFSVLYLLPDSEWPLIVPSWSLRTYSTQW